MQKNGPRDRITINRRTFIKALGGFVIAAPFVGVLAPAHSQGLPDNLPFKTTTSRWSWNDKCLDAGCGGSLTIYQNDEQVGQAEVDEDGRLDFLLPTNADSVLKLEIPGCEVRTFKAVFQDGLLYLKNADRGDRAAAYYWVPETSSYRLEYWEDDVYICGPADGDGYLLGMASIPLGDVGSYRAGLFMPVTPPTPNALRAWYKMNDDVNRILTLTDSSPRGMDLTLSGGAVQVVDGVSGDAIAVHAANTAFKRAGAARDDSVFSITAWIKVRSDQNFNGHQVILSNGGVDHIIFGVDENTLKPYVATSQAQFQEADDSVTSGYWTYVAAVCDGSEVKFWINDSKTAGQAFTYGFVPGPDWYLARDDNGNVLYGQLDEVRYYSRVLSDDEVIFFYENPSGDARDAQDIDPRGNEDALGIHGRHKVLEGDYGQPAGSYCVTRKSCSCGSADSCEEWTTPPNFELDNDARSGGGSNLIPPALYFPVVPTKASLDEAADLKARLNKIDFGLTTQWTRPDERSIKGWFPIGESRSLPGGPTVTVGWDGNSYIPRLMIQSDWPYQTMDSRMQGLHCLTFWIKTTDGRESNRRSQYFNFE